MKKKPLAVQEFADVLTQADGSPIFSLLVTLEELEGMARCELSEQLIETCQQRLMEYEDSVGRFRARGMA